MNPDIFKSISIRGRFAFGMICLENLIQHFSINDTLLHEVVEGYWKFTNSDKLGQYEDFFNTMSPDCILSDFPKLKENPEKLHEFGYDNISFEKMMSVFDLYEKLPKDLTSIMTHLSYIANSDISAGCGEFSSSTFEPTIRIWELMSYYPVSVTPKIENFIFSNFKENHGWGNKFERSNLQLK